MKRESQKTFKKSSEKQQGSKIPGLPKNSDIIDVSKLCRLRPIERFILLLLRGWITKTRKVFFHTQKEFAEDIGIEVRQFRKYQKRLEELGLLIVEPRKTANPDGNNYKQYRLNFPWPVKPALSGQKEADQTGTFGQSNRHFQVIKPAFSGNQTGTPVPLLISKDKCKDKCRHNGKNDDDFSLIDTFQKSLPAKIQEYYADLPKVDLTRSNGGDRYDLQNVVAPFIGKRTRTR